MVRFPIVFVVVVVVIDLVPSLHYSTTPFALNKIDYENEDDDEDDSGITFVYAPGQP
jgi:hypothetical protein